MSDPKPQRSLYDIRTLSEAQSRALSDSGKATETVAERIGCKASYLMKALNPHEEDVHFQARLLVPFCEATGSILPLEWMAHQLGYVLVLREQAATARDIAMETLDVGDEAGKLSHTVRAAYADGQLTEQERLDIKEQANRVQREAAEVVRAVSTSPISLTPKKDRTA